MFDFRVIRLEDKDWISERLKISNFRGCEYSFANNLAWRRLNDTVISSFDDFYISCSFSGGQPYVTFPAGVKTDSDEGKEKYTKLFYELKKYMENQGKKFTVSSVNSENLKWMQDYYGENISVFSDRNNFDYIYNAQDLINLAGRKYHGKRNHIKRFMEHDWSYETASKENYNECIAFAAEFYNNNSSYDDFSAVVEQYAINTFFENMDYLGLKCGMLRSDGRLVGISIGEQLNSDTFVVHVEKAISDVQGAYPTLCNQFAKSNAENSLYINREEDLGIEGLRKSKLSYRPAFLLEKNIVAFK